MQKLYRDFKSQISEIIFKSLLVLGVFSLLLSILGFVQGQAIEKQVDAYEKEIQLIEIPQLELIVDEEGKYDKEALVATEEALALASKELKLLEQKISSDSMSSVFGTNEKKVVLLKSVSSKMDNVSASVESVSAFVKEAEKKAIAHAEKIEKERLAKEAKEDAEKAEQARLDAEKESKKKDSVASAPTNGSTTKVPSTSSTSDSKTGTKTTTTTKTQPKTTTTTTKTEPKTEPVKEPQPAYGSISRKNENVSEYWQWEHGEFYYIWNGSSWNTYIRPGSTVTDRDRWVSHLQKAFPQPTREGTADGEKVGAGTIWVYFGGKF